MAEQKQALDRFAVVTETDPQGRITYVNDRFCEISQYRPEEALGKDHRDLLSSGHHPKAFWKEMWETITRGEVWRGDIKNQAKDGSTGWMDTIIVPCMGPDGTPEKYLAIRIDITERKEAEERLRLANARLERLNSLKDEFVGTVSHELRTPLAISQEAISQVLDGITGAVNEEQKRVLDISRRNIERLARLINDLLDISKLEAGKVKLLKTRVSLLTLAHQIAAVFEPRAKAKGLTLRVHSDQDELAVYADVDRMAQIITNLVGNAVKFTTQGAIEVSLSAHGPMVECAVTDTGPGIQAGDIQWLFSKFQQFSRPSGGGGEKGTGLGLAITKQLVELHHGTIAVESEPGNGATFTVRLPRYTAETPLREQLRDGIARAQRAAEPLSLLYIGLPESFQPEEQPALRLSQLSETATDILQHHLLRSADVVVDAVGGIAVLLANCTHEAAMGIQDRVNQALNARLPLRGTDEQRSWRFGCATYPDDGSRAEELLTKTRQSCESTRDRRAGNGAPDRLAEAEVGHAP